MIAAWRWWCVQMADLLPRRWQGGEQWIAQWRQDRLVPLQRRGGDLTEAEPPPETSLTLQIADRRPWRRHLSLPRAAAPYLRQILGNEMDRRTPWRADQVYFDATPAKGGESGQLAVTLTVLPRQWAGPALAAAAARGWRADRILLEDEGTALSIADGEPLATGGRTRKPALALASVVGAALLSLAVQAAWEAVLDVQLSTARQEAATARALAGETSALRRRQHFPAVRREESPSAIAVLNRLSRALPDDSWIDEFEMKDRQVTFAGISAEPARLLALLQAEGFAGAEFGAPVTPAEGGGQRFQIRATLEGADHDFR